MGKGIVDELSREFDLQVEWIPFELHHETPEEGVKVSDFFPGTNVEYMFHVLNTAIKPYGLKFAGADLMANTEKALMATEYARDHGKAHEFHDEMFQVYFTEGKNIAEADVLREVAARSGLDPDEMMEKVADRTYRSRLSEGKKAAYHYSVTSTPTFIIDDRLKIVGAQSLDVFRKAFAELSAEA